MIEQWNTGMMGWKEFFLQLEWFISALIPNTPVFQYSIIPSFHGSGINQEPLKDFQFQPIVEYLRRLFLSFHVFPGTTSTVS